MKTYRITPKAERDLLGIGHYTLDRWGEAQRNTYLRSLINRFSWLCEFPDLGTKRDDIKEGYCAYQEGKHMIFYIIREEHIDIIGVLHERMDYKTHF